MSNLQDKRAALRRTAQRPRLKIITAEELIAYPFRHREYLLHPWLRQGESAMVWAQSGLGKTWATLTMALLVAGGGECLSWRNETPRRVLVIDGEMHGEDLKDRIKLLAPAVDGIDMKRAGPNLHLLPRQMQDGRARFPNLADPGDQEWVLDEIGRVGAELVVCDNFSTLAEVPDENDASAMTPVLSFLLKLKQLGIACILVHHSGKGGTNYRGSSKLEATFEVILGLVPWESVKAGGGTAFETVWKKNRGKPHAGTTGALVRLEDQAEGGVRWVAEPSESDAMARLVGVVMTGEFSTQKAVGDHLGWSGGQVTKVKLKAIQAGRITEQDWETCLREARRGADDGEAAF
jgi:hypothetical protein